MVHIAPDSRILVSLVKQEQAYAAQLHSLLSASGTSLSALLVYASSSPPAVSPVLNGVAGSFSGADDALRTYAESLNYWIDQLGRIKQKEEEVTNIIRDREILVTRLLKASRKSKPPAPSLLHAAPDLSSSASFSTFNSKTSNAQADLQACEFSLAERVRELEDVRVHAISQGLRLRCNALVQCGQAWCEMGRRAIEVLGGLDTAHSLPNGHAPEFYKPLPDPKRDYDHDSLQSSVGPSQSASQIGVMQPTSAAGTPEKPYRLHIPAPHHMWETNVIPQTSELPGGSSSEEEGPVEVHENPRFKNSVVSKNTWRTTQAPSARQSHVPFPGSNSDIETKFPHSEKKRTALFGSIAALFRTSVIARSGSGTQSEGGWHTRTDRNLRSVKADEEQNSDGENEYIRSGRLRRGKDRSSLPVFAATAAYTSGGISSQPSESTTSATVHLKRTGKLGKTHSIRSAVSEPPSRPRPRAITMSAPSSQTVIGDSRTRSHERTASMDGRWGLTNAGTNDNVPPRDPSSHLEVVHAPGSTVSQLPLLVHPPPPLPAVGSAPSSPVVSKTPTSNRTSMPIPTTNRLLGPPSPTTPEKKPLRSAMRKSPSPSTSPNVQAVSDGNQSPPMAPLSLPALPPSFARPRPASVQRLPVPSTIAESPRQSLMEAGTDLQRQSYMSTKTDDSASISSYETGHENFDDDVGTESEQKQANPSTPPVSSQETKEADRQESSISTDTPPTRRKSVRMSSLPPQVSRTPPALDEWSDSQNLPRSDKPSGRYSMIPAREAALSWEDSSSEDELYKTARKALTRADGWSQKHTKR